MHSAAVHSRIGGHSKQEIWSGHRYVTHQTTEIGDLHLQIGVNATPVTPGLGSSSLPLVAIIDPRSRGWRGTMIVFGFGMLPRLCGVLGYASCRQAASAVSRAAARGRCPSPDRSSNPCLWWAPPSGPWDRRPRRSKCQTPAHGYSRSGNRFDSRTWKEAEERWREIVSRKKHLTCLPARKSCAKKIINLFTAKICKYMCTEVKHLELNRFSDGEWWVLM